jgi:membrane-anchored mycosin MYCP
MAENPPAKELQGPRGDYYNADIVVERQHLDLVMNLLDDPAHRVPAQVVRESDLLGLALLRLTDEEHAGEKSIDEYAADTIIGLLTDKGKFRDPDKPLDRFLSGLRAYFAERYAGWIPTIGKNRLLGSVVGGGKISHGGGDEPDQATEPQGLADRVDEPGRGVRVGVLDTHLAPHSWILGGWVARRQDVLVDAPARRAVAGHATFVTGLVLRQAPGCVVEVRSVLSDENGQADAWSVAEGIVELGRSGLDVLNLSLFCRTDDDLPSLLLATAIERLNPDTVVVAAAGNHGREKEADGTSRPTWPAALPHVVAVGSARSEGQPAETTPQRVPWVDVHSTGEGVVSTFLTGDVMPSLPEDEWQTEKHDEGTKQFKGFARWSGSSFAAAKVTGAIAARTIPGRMSARAAWTSLRPADPEGVQGSRDPLEPFFLPLEGFEQSPTKGG